MKRRLAIALNIGIRVAIIYFLAEAWIFQDDPRFLNKAIPLRNTIIVGGLSLLFPAVWYLRKKKWSHYPWVLDFVYLSIFGLDMAGNSFNLYNTYYYFDLIPHFHGTGAAALVFAVVGRSKKMSFWDAVLFGIGVGTLVHVALEAQEYYTDVFAKTINVRGQSDTINDLVVGLLGSFIYTIGGLRLFLRHNPGT